MCTTLGTSSDYFIRYEFHAYDSVASMMIKKFFTRLSERFAHMHASWGLNISSETKH